MKTTNITCISHDDFVAHLRGLIDQNQKETATGSKRGGIYSTARQLDVAPQVISNIVNRWIRPSKALLESMGLEKKVVYVKLEG